MAKHSKRISKRSRKPKSQKPKSRKSKSRKSKSKPRKTIIKKLLSNKKFVGKVNKSLKHSKIASLYAKGGPVAVEKAIEKEVFRLTPSMDEYYY